MDFISCVKAEGYKMQKKLEAINMLFIDGCKEYGTELCQEGISCWNPTGWKGCLTRKTLDILEVK